MKKYKFKDDKGKEYIVELYDIETAEMFAEEMELELIERVDNAS